MRMRLLVKQNAAYLLKLFYFFNDSNAFEKIAISLFFWWMIVSSIANFNFVINRIQTQSSFTSANKSLVREI